MNVRVRADDTHRPAILVVGNVDVVLKLDVGAKVLHEVGLIIDAEVAIQSCQFFSKIVESKC